LPRRGTTVICGEMCVLGRKIRQHLIAFGVGEKRAKQHEG
jgi:hypothetical protein